MGRWGGGGRLETLYNGDWNVFFLLNRITNVSVGSCCGNLVHSGIKRFSKAGSCAANSNESDLTFLTTLLLPRTLTYFTRNSGKQTETRVAIRAVFEKKKIITWFWLWETSSHDWATGKLWRFVTETTRTRYHNILMCLMSTRFKSHRLVLYRGKTAVWWLSLMSRQLLKVRVGWNPWWCGPIHAEPKGIHSSISKMTKTREM